MQISEHPNIQDAHRHFMVALGRLRAAVRGTDVALVGQHVSWQRRGRTVHGVIVEVPASAPWLLVVATGPNAKRERRHLDQVSYG